MTLNEIKTELSVFKKFTFHEGPHIYTYEDNGETKQIGISTTTLIHSYASPFDEEKIAKLSSRKKGMPVEDLIEMWHFERDFACEKGTAIHAYLEHRFGNMDPYTYDKNKIIETFSYDPIEPVWDKLKSLADEFYEIYHDRLIPIGTELVIGSIEYDVAGSVDFLAYSRKLNAIILLDYKSNKEIKKESYKDQKMLPPINNLPDCNYYHYSLQLAIYKYIIERETKLKVYPYKWLIWINENNDKFELYQCLNLDTEAKLLLETRKNELRSK